jgi:hypothetical protein
MKALTAIFLVALLSSSPSIAGDDDCDGLTPFVAIQMTVERALDECDAALTIDYKECKPSAFYKVRKGLDALKASGCIFEYDIGGMGGSHSAGFGEFEQINIVAATRSKVFYVSSRRTFIRDSDWKSYSDFLMSYRRHAREGCHEGCPQ